LTWARWKRRTSSSLKILASLSLAKALKFNSLGNKQVNFAFLSSSSINYESCCFSFFINPVEFFAHPLKYCRRDLILFCHNCMVVSPLLSCCQIEETKSKNPSLTNHPNSNLNSKKFLKLVGALSFSNKGIWSDRDLSNVWTVTLGNLSSHSGLIKTLSSFSNVGGTKAFAQVNCRPTIYISRNSKFVMIALNRSGHRKLKFSLLLSSALRIMLKSPYDKRTCFGTTHSCNFS
jgi:hypothetical protein